MLFWSYGMTHVFSTAMGYRITFESLSQWPTGQRKTLNQVLYYLRNSQNLFLLNQSLYFLAFINLLRRIERLFTKISKSNYAKRSLDWTSIAGILDGLDMALERDENIVKVVYFKLVINSAITLVINENQSETIASVNTSSVFLSQLAAASKTEPFFQVPIVYSNSLIK